METLTKNLKNLLKTNGTNEKTLLIFKFHEILKNKLFTAMVQSCNSKDELNYYIKPKDKLEALHDKFIRYGTKKATSFLIIDIDNEKIPFEKYCKKVEQKLKDIKPNWILKTDKGYHIGFILDNPIWFNNKDQVKTAQEIKKNLTIILNGDIAGSYRLIGYWRNPLTHHSKLSLKLHNLETLQKKVKNLSKDKKINTIKENKTIKSNWEQIDKKGFVKGNRNNFLFKKVVGMLYNGLITNDEVLTTLEILNNDELDPKEIEKIAKSILKYNIKPNKNIKQQGKKIYRKDLTRHGIHNYKEKNKINFERQKFGQKTTTAEITKKTILKLLDGYFLTFKNKEKFINKNLQKNSKLSKRTIQRYRNERKLEKAIKTKAFLIYIKSLVEGVKVAVTPINDLLNLAIKNLIYYYPKTKKIFKFEYNSENKLTFFELLSYA